MVPGVSQALIKSSYGLSARSLRKQALALLEDKRHRDEVMSQGTQPTMGNTGIRTNQETSISCLLLMATFPSLTYLWGRVYPVCLGSGQGSRLSETEREGLAF